VVAVSLKKKIGAMRTMPGLPSKPAYMNVDIGEDGEVIGLF